MKLEVARPIGQGLIAVALFLFLVPLVNVGLQVTPWRPGDQNWRFGAWGFFLGAITLPVLGLGLLGVGGAVRNSIAVVRVTLILASLLFIGAVAGLADFVIEGSALKGATTDPKILTLMDREIRRTVLISVVALPALAALTIGSYKLLNGMQLPDAAKQGSGPLVGTGHR